jgi:recombination protein RecA
MAEKKGQQTLAQAIAELEKTYGKGTVIHGKNPTVQVSGPIIDTGSIGLNYALGIGGVVTGKIYEIIGWESTGKSTLCQTIIGNAQKKGLKCIYVDAENSLDRDYAKALGVDMEDLYIIQMDDTAGEGAYNKVDKLVETGEIDMVIYDSYNALQPKSVLEGEVGDSAIGKHARMLGQAVMKANYLSMKHGTTFVFIGQLRQKIGVMFGSPDTTQGGNALKFYAHVRIETTRSISKDNSVFNGEIKIGNQTIAKVIKNKLSAPFKKAEFNVLYGVGIDKLQEVVDLGKDLGLLTVRKEKLIPYITYEGTKYSESEFKSLLIDNPEFYSKISANIQDKMGQEIVLVEEKIEADAV